jgi:hypothetical protein
VINLEKLKEKILAYIEDKKELAKSLSEMIKLKDPDSERLKSLRMISNDAP